MAHIKSPGRTIRIALSNKHIVLSTGCQRSQLLHYMDRIGVKGCEERFDKLVSSLLADVKNWRREKQPIETPTKEVMEEFLRWAIEACKE